MEKIRTIFLKSFIVGILFVFCFINSTTVEAKKQDQDIIDSLVKDLPVAKSDSQRIRDANAIAYLYNSIDPTEGLKYAKQGMELSDKIGWKKEKAYSYNTIATLYEVIGDYSAALDNLNMALVIYKDGNNKEDIGVCKEIMGNVYVEQCEFTNALKDYFEVLKINDELKNQQGIARNYGNIAIVYEIAGDYPFAYYYNWKALKMQEQFSDISAISLSYLNLANVYNDLTKYDSAVEYGSKALKYFEEIGDKNLSSTELCNLGAIYKNIKNYSKALECCNKSYQTVSGIDAYKKCAASALGNMGEIYLQIAQDSTGNLPVGELIPQTKKANVDKAIEYLQKGVAGCNETKDKIGIIEFSKYLSQAYKLSGNYAGAYQYYTECVKLRKIILSFDCIREIEAMKNAHLEAIRNAQLLEINNKQTEQLRIANAKKKKEIIILLSAVTFLTIVVFLQFRNKSNRKNH